MFKTSNKSIIAKLKCWTAIPNDKVINEKSKVKIEKLKPSRIIATVVTAKTQAKYIETIIKNFLLLA